MAVDIEPAAISSRSNEIENKGSEGEGDGRGDRFRAH
jgi:hypothetical protein